MQQENKAPRALILIEAKESVSELQPALEVLGCLSQVVKGEGHLQFPLRQQVFDLIFVDYGLVADQKVNLASMRQAQPRAWFVIVVPRARFYQEEFRRSEHLDWGFQDLILSPLRSESLNDVLRRWERKMSTATIDSTLSMRVRERHDGRRYYQSFAQDLSSFRQESLQLLAGHELRLLSALARKFTARAREAGFVRIAENVQSLESGQNTPLLMWKNILSDCEQLERQLERVLENGA